MHDPPADSVSFTLVVAIFEPSGNMPPNSQAIAEEAFFVSAGASQAIARGICREIGPSDVLVLPLGIEHVAVNTAPTKPGD